MTPLTINPAYTAAICLAAGGVTALLVACAVRLVMKVLDRRGKVVVTTMFLIALAILWPTSDALRTMGVSDAYEYLQATTLLLDRGVFALQIGPHELPPRYAPWFSIAFIGPVMALSPDGWEYGGSLVIPIVLSGALTAALCTVFGYRIGGVWGGLLAGSLTLIIPDLRHLSQMTMTDVPAAALSLLALGLLQVAENRRPGAAPVRDRDFTVSFLGITLIAALLRPTCLALLVPYLLQIRWVPRAGLSLHSDRIIPAAATAAAAVGLPSLYNCAVFDSPFVSGYNFWVPEWYDSPFKTFVISALPANLHTAFVDAQLLPIWFASITLLLMRRSCARDGSSNIPHDVERILVNVGLFAAPMLAFHLLYFYQTPRFYLTLSCAGAALLGGLGGSLDYTRRAAVSAVLSAALLLAAGFSAKAREPGPTQDRLLSDIETRTPGNAVVISSLNPVFLSLMAAPTRLFIPASRQDPYVERTAAVIGPPTIDPQLIPAEDLGADLLTKVATRPIYLARPLMQPGTFASLSQMFSLTEISPRLFAVDPTQNEK